MAAASFSHSSAAVPRRRQSTNNLLLRRERDADSDLSHSMRQLSLAASSQSKSPASSSGFRPSIHRSSSVASSRGAPRSPLNGPSPPTGRDSRSATPTLLRKASLNSLHSSASGALSARRASSVNLMSPSLRSPLGAGASSPAESHEKPAPTAASIANAHFKAELRLRHGEGSRDDAEAVVILHDSCYGHRYSRPRTSKSALSTIVERPERLKAGVLGVCIAYVRLGERHAEGHYQPHPKLDPASIPSIPFRIQKTTRKLPLMSQTVTNVHGTKWMEELKLMCDSAESKLALNGKELQRPEMNRGPDSEAPQKLHEGDLYLCAESLDALESALGGVCEAVDAVFAPSGPKRAFVAIRPPGHHCSATYPSGFCWINNVHVGIMHATLSQGLTHAAIIDFDLHHGDGSQSIAWQHNSRGFGLSKNAAWWKKTSIGYFSLHDINSYPCETGDEEKVKNASICVENAHGQSIWNVHLEPWKTEAEFWELYETKYIALLDKARRFLASQNDRLRLSNQNSKAAIFLSAGFDASEWETASMQRHKVNVPTEFYARLTRDVTRLAAEDGLGVEGRIISVLEGGYSDRALCSGILSHLSGLAGSDPVPTKEEDYNGLGFEMGRKIGSVPGRRDSLSVKSAGRPYEAAWWHASELEKIEAIVLPPPPEPRKAPRAPSAHTFASPTQASKAKVVAAPKLRRSTSNLSLYGAPSRPPSPPPPEVPWTVAVHELSKLLIPSDRQTESCTVEDLSAEATRVRRDRQALLSQSLPPGSTPAVAVQGSSGPGGPTRVSLRERKQVKPFGSIEEEEEQKRGRRKTVAGPSVLPTEKGMGRGVVGRPKQPGRRLSAASTIVSEAPELELSLPTSSNGSTRPTTSESVRPESSMSMATTAGAPLAVKKTRAINTAKKEAPKAPRAAHKKSISAAPTMGKPSAPAAPAAPAHAASSAAPAAGKAADDMDKLTTGMKRIKITVVTAAQKEAREKAKKESAEREAASSAQATNLPTPVSEPEQAVSPVSPVAASNITAASDDASSRLSKPQASPVHQTFQKPQLGLPSGIVLSTPAQDRPAVSSPSGPRKVPQPDSSPVLFQSPSPQPRSGGTTPTTTAAPGETVFVAYEPEGATPQALPQTQPLQWLPPNTSAATPAATPSPMKRADLPVFTSTSAIPFAPRPATAASSEGGGSRRALSPALTNSPAKTESLSPRQRGLSPSPSPVVWEVPDTPRPQ